MFGSQDWKCCCNMATIRLSRMEIPKGGMFWRCDIIMRVSHKQKVLFSLNRMVEQLSKHLYKELSKCRFDEQLVTSLTWTSAEPPLRSTVIFKGTRRRAVRIPSRSRWGKRGKNVRVHLQLFVKWWYTMRRNQTMRCNQLMSNIKISRCNWSNKQIFTFALWVMRLWHLRVFVSRFCVQITKLFPSFSSQ